MRTRRNPMLGRHRPHRGYRYPERGAVAGLEGVMFGVLVLLGGMVLLVNAWAVIDTRTALDASLREYLRTYTRQSDGISARRRGAEAAESVLAARNSHPAHLTIEVSEPNGFGPCSVVTVRLSATVPALRAPFLDDFTAVTVSAEGSDLMDAHRELTADSAYDATATACFGE